MLNWLMFRTFTTLAHISLVLSNVGLWIVEKYVARLRR